MTTSEHRAAIAAAEQWLAGRWQQAATGKRPWVVGYQLKPEPPMPLGIGSFGKTGALAGEAPPPGAIPAAPIVGLATVAAVACTTYEIGPGPGYIVRFRGRGLRFNEGGTGWSKPLPSALLHVLDVRPPAAPGGAQTVVNAGTARTALPPDATLSQASAKDLEQAAARVPTQSKSRKARGKVLSP